MTKHPAQASKTPPRTAQEAGQGVHSTPSAERPANRKWRIENWDYATSHWAAPGRQIRVRWEEEPWQVGHGTGLPTHSFPTWHEAMAHVNREIRAEQWVEVPRQPDSRRFCVGGVIDDNHRRHCPACVGREA